MSNDSENDASKSASGNNIRRLYRSRTNRVFFGVCGGIAEYFNIDPIVVRILTLLSLFAGVGFLVYFAAAIIIPNNPATAEQHGKGTQRTNMNLVLGTILVIVGGLLLMDQFGIFHRGWFHFSFFPWRLFWPIALIGFGIWFIASGASFKNTSRQVKNWAGNAGLRKSRTDKMFGGVCGGLGKHLEIDSTIVRILWAIGTLFTGGLGFLAYIALLIILPYENEESPEINEEPAKK